MRPWLRPRALLLALTLPGAASAASLEQITLAGREEGNLLALATLLATHRDELSGELAEFADAVGAAQTPDTARLLLRELLPELARHRALRRTWVLPGAARARQPAPAAGQPVSADSYPWMTRYLGANEPAVLTTLWLQGGWDSAEQDNRDGIDGFDSDADSLLLGLEREVLPGLVLGIGGGRADSRVITPGRGRDDAESDDYLAYTRYYRGAHRFDLQVSVRDSVAHRLRMIRLIRDGELRLVALNARVDSEETAVSVSWSADLDLDNGVYLAPALSVTHLSLSTDDYLESGAGGFALMVETEDETQLLASAGLTMGVLANRGAWTLSPALRVSVSHALQADDMVTTSTFQGTRFGFTSRGYSVEQTRLSAAVSLGAYHQSGFGVSLGFSRDWQDDYRADALTASVDFTF